MYDPPATIGSSKIKCVQCGYDLGGSAIGGICPECGMPVQNSLTMPDDVKLNNSNSSNATMCLILALVGLSACPPIGTAAILVYYMAKKDVMNGLAPVKSMGMAKTGLVIGWICAAVTVLALIGIAIFFLSMV